MSEVRPGIYRHFKYGNHYMVFGVATDAAEPASGETLGPPRVFYRALYGDFKFAYRTIEDFCAEVDRPEFSYKGPRFTLIRPL